MNRSGRQAWMAASFVLVVMALLIWADSVSAQRDARWWWFLVRGPGYSPHYETVGPFDNLAECQKAADHVKAVWGCWGASR